MNSEKENILIIEKNSDGVLKLTLNDDQNKNSLSELMITSNIKDLRAGITPPKLASSLIAEAIIRGVSK